MSLDCNIPICSNEFARVVIRESEDDLLLCVVCAEAFRLGMSCPQVRFIAFEDWESDETESGAAIFCRIPDCQTTAIQVAIREGEPDLPLCSTCIEAFNQGMSSPEGQIISLEEWLAESEDGGELSWLDDPAADALANKEVRELNFGGKRGRSGGSWLDDPAAETLTNMAAKEVFPSGSTKRSRRTKSLRRRK